MKNYSKNSSLWDDLQFLPVAPWSSNGRHIRVCAFHNENIAAVISVDTMEGWAISMNFCIETLSVSDLDHINTNSILGFGIARVAMKNDNLYNVRLLISVSALPSDKQLCKGLNGLGTAILAQLISRTYPKKDVA